MADRPDSGSSFLIACFKTARDELLFRVRHRDAWLKASLFAQASLLALSLGIKLPGLEVEGNHPIFASLAPFVSLVFVCMYNVEDTLVGCLNEYIATLSDREATLHQRSDQIVNWDVSSQLREHYARSNGLVIRFVAQLLSFVIIPAIIGVLGLWTIVTVYPQWERAPWVIGCLMLVALVVNLAICIKGYVFRMKTAAVPDTEGGEQESRIRRIVFFGFRRR